MTSRGIRLLKSMERLSNMSPTFDHSVVLSKVKLHSASNGSLKGFFTVEPTMCNTGGFLHGGYIASVVDVLSFYTQLSNTDGRGSWTTCMNLNYTGASKNGEKVNVETKSLKGGNSAVIETYFHNENGRLLAKGITTFLAAHDKYQKSIKEAIGFDVYEN